MSDHSGTHVDAPKHFGPGGASIDELPLEDFYTSAIALDLSHVELRAAISVREMEEALEKAGEEIREGDTVLIHMAFNKRVGFDEPRWQHDFPGLHPDSVRWLADRGCKMFGECDAINSSSSEGFLHPATNVCCPQAWKRSVPVRRGR